MIDELMGSLSFTEKVGQLNQRLLGWKAVERRGGTLVVTDDLKKEIDRWGGLGLLYGLFRADPWSGRSWSDGIPPQERGEAAQLVQDTVRERGNSHIGVLLSEEAPHGHQALGGTILPTNLALGATFDPDLVRRTQASVASELSASGVHIALVSGLDIARDPRWGRCEECFGEDPLLAAQMCEATVLGMQGKHQERFGKGGVAVVLKHLAAQGEAVGGRNGQSAIIGDRDLRQIHLPPVAAGVKAGVWGFMAAYNDIDGTPCCANPWLLKTYLRDELGFDGAIMADGLAVDRLEEMTGSIPAAGRAALLSGVDISLWDEGFTQLTRFADDPAVCSAVDAAVRKVLTLKQRFGLLGNGSSENDISEKAVSENADETSAQLLHAMENTRELARRCARESLVVLQGEPAAQFRCADSTNASILVTGPFAQDSSCFLGDYTAPLCSVDAVSVTDELRTRLGEKAHIVSKPATDIKELTDWDLRSFDVVIAVLGGTSERRYTDSFDSNGAALAVAERGATGGEGVDLSDIDLPWGQGTFIHDLSKETQSPVISVVVSGRAHVLTPVLESSDAVVWAGYPGQFAAGAIVDALQGLQPMTGRMPVTLPGAAGAIPVRYNDRQSADNVYKDTSSPVLRPFGFSGKSDTVKSIEVKKGKASLEVTLRGSFSVPPLLFAQCIDGVHIPRRSELVGIGVSGTTQTNAVTWTIPLSRFVGEKGSARVTFFSEECHSEDIKIGDGSSTYLGSLHTEDPSEME
jgi:beta-glucosidase